MSVNGLMTQTCNIWRKTEAISSATGFTANTWTIPYTNVPCLIQAKSGFNNTNAGAGRSTSKFQGFFPFGTDVQFEDRIETSGDPDVFLTGFSVTSAPLDEAGKREFIACDLEYVQGKGGVT